MKVLTRMTDALSRRRVNAGRTRARLDLLERNDRFLADNGFSRELLEQGNGLWPWRIDGSVPTAAPRFALPSAGPRESVPAAPPSMDYARAEKELEAFSDAELFDIGIVRANIATAVRTGRPGIDGPGGEGRDREAA